MTDRFNSANLEVKREPDMQGVGSNSPSSANVQVKNERLNGYPDDGGKFFNKIAKKSEIALSISGIDKVAMLKNRPHLAKKDYSCMSLYRVCHIFLDFKVEGYSF